jgi:tape measure domain-containing protein
MADNAQLFQRFAISADSLGATTDQLLAVTETVSNLGRVSGSSSEDIKNSTRQLAQAFGSTFFRAEEFNSVLEQMPAVITSISSGLGVSNAELNKMVKNGELLSSRAFAALLNSQEAARIAADKLPLTYAQSMNSIKNSVLIVSNEINKQIGLTSILSGAATQLGDIMQASFGMGSAGARSLADDLATGQKAMNVLAAIVVTLGEISVAVYDAIAKAAIDGLVIIIKGFRDFFAFAIDGFNRLRQAASKVPGFGDLATDMEIAAPIKAELDKLDAALIRTSKRAKEAQEAFNTAFETTPGGISVDSELGQKVIATQRAFDQIKEARDAFVKDNTKGLQSFILADSRSTTDDIITSLERIKEASLDLGEGILAPFQANYDKITASTKAFAEEQDRILGKLADKISTDGKFLDQFTALTSGTVITKMNELGESIKKAEEFLVTFKNQLTPDQVDNVSSAITKMKKELEGLAMTEVDIGTPLLDTFNELTSNTNITKIANLRTAIKDAEKFIAKFGSSFDDTALANMREAVTLLKKDLVDLTGPEDGGFVFGENFINGINQAFDTLGSSVSDNLVGKLFGEESSFQDIAKSFVKSILSTILQELIFSPIVNSIKEAWGKILNPEQEVTPSTGGSGRGGAGGIFSLLGGLAGGAGGVLGSLGGLVGKAFTPSTAASLASPATMGAAASNTDQRSVTFNISTPDAGSFQAARGRVQGMADSLLRNT